MAGDHLKLKAMHECSVNFDNYSHLKFMGSFIVSVDRYL
jgi:hypothetical protein